MIKILKKLIKMHNSGLKEDLSRLQNKEIDKFKDSTETFKKLKKDHDDIFAVLISYLNTNDSFQPSGLEENIIIQKFVYSFLFHMVNKNKEFKKQIEEEFNLLKLLDIKSIKIKEFIEKKILKPEDPTKQVANTDIYLKMINKFLSLVKEIIGTDLGMRTKIKVNCNNIYFLIILINDWSSSNDFVLQLYENASIIFKELNNYEVLQSGE